MAEKKSKRAGERGLILREAIRKAGLRPPGDSGRAEKKRYAELVSKELARAVALALRERGLGGVSPPVSESGSEGMERRIAGGLGDKRVDVSYATESSGLVLAISIKTISFPDSKSGNYQKNLQNRKGDLMFEVTTLHKRFPYAVVGGLFFFYEDAARDNVGRTRISTFERAHQVLKIFNRRIGPRNEESKFEFLAIGLYRSAPPRYALYEAGDAKKGISFKQFLSELLRRVAERNPEQFVFQDGHLFKPSQLGLSGEDP